MDDQSIEPALKHLHAYWRMEYLEAPKIESPSTLFSDIPKVLNDADVFLLVRRVHSYLMLNRYPYNAGHLLAVPYRAVSTLEDLKSEERVDLMEAIIQAQSLLEKAFKPHGFNIGFNIGKASGAGIPQHIHAHIVPRWQGDTNFMPVIGGTKVLPQSLEGTYARLKEFL